MLASFDLFFVDKHIGYEQRVETMFKRGKMSKLFDIQSLFYKIGFTIKRIDNHIMLHQSFPLELFFHIPKTNLQINEESEGFIVHHQWIHIPDFIITHPNGYCNYLKIIDWDNIVLSKKGFEIFNVYPGIIILTMKSYFADPVLSELIFSDDADSEFIDQIRETFFQIHRFEEKTSDGITTITSSLQDWVKKEFGVSKDRLIEEYIAWIIMGHRMLSYLIN